MLLLVTNRKSTGGFFSRRRADKGKIPPVITGVKMGAYTAARLELSGRKLSNNLHFLEPYIRRGDVLVASRALDSALGYNAPLIEEYARRQCVNFCVAAIRAGEKCRRLQVALVDKEGECVGVAAELLKVCNTVWVATGRPELFLPCAQYTRQTYGNEPLFAKDFLPSVDVVLAPYGCQGWATGGGILLAEQSGAYPKPDQLYTPDYVNQSEIDPLSLTAGLFEAFHPKELMTALPTGVTWGNRRFDVEAFSELLCKET